MKKFIIFILLAVMATSLVGCSSNKEVSSSATSATESTTQNETVMQTTKSTRSKTTQKATEQETLLSRDKETYTNDITYDMIARNPDDYKNKPCKFSGKVIQIVQEKSGVSAIRFAVDDDYNKIALVVYDPSIVSGRLLENDKITIYGGFVELYTYSSTLGKSITVPELVAVMIDMNNSN